jgi:hypothetical protein
MLIKKFNQVCAVAFIGPFGSQEFANHFPVAIKW